MESGGDLKSQLEIDCVEVPTVIPSLNERLSSLINQAPVMLFMKGSPEQPKCGFSRTIVNILKDENIAFNSFDIFTDEDVRQGLKSYSNWPTYPQLYVKGISFNQL